MSKAVPEGYCPNAPGASRQASASDPATGVGRVSPRAGAIFLARLCGRRDHRACGFSSTSVSDISENHPVPVTLRP